MDKKTPGTQPRIAKFDKSVQEITQQPGHTNQIPKRANSTWKMGKLTLEN